MESFEASLQMQCKSITCTTPFPIPLTLHKPQIEAIEIVSKEQDHMVQYVYRIIFVSISLRMHFEISTQELCKTPNYETNKSSSLKVSECNVQYM